MIQTAAKSSSLFSLPFVFSNLIQLFLSSWWDLLRSMQPSHIGSETAQRHTYMHLHTPFFFFFTRFCLPVIPQHSTSVLFLPLLVFNFLSLVTQHKQTQMHQTKRSFQCIKSEIQSLVAMCAPCPLPRLNICLPVIPWWVVAHKKTGQSLYPCPPLSSPSPSQWINIETNWPSGL